MSKVNIDITMPSLGSDMRDGMLVEWQISEGDHVNKGDIIAVIETNKGAIDMESYHTGTISQILAQPIVSLPVGSVLARMEMDSDTVQLEPQVSQPSPIVQPQQSDIQPTPPTTTTSTTSLARQRVLASPVVRRIAQQNHWDLTSVKGSGPNHAVLLRDIADLTEHTSSAPTTCSEAVKPSGYNLPAMRVAIAEAMEKSKQKIPHYYLTLDIDLSLVTQWLRMENAKREPDDRILLLAVLLAATAKVLPKFPALNGFYSEGHFASSPNVHIGNVISLRGGGLVVPAIHDVNTLTLDATMNALRDITNRSRTGRLRSSELTDATITVTSIGERGSDTVLGVIYPPQVAIIGFGRSRQLPQVKDGKIEICDMINVSLSADHRVSDGSQGAKFLNALSNQLQKPDTL